MTKESRLSPGCLASIVVGVTVMALLVVDLAYVEWRNHKVEAIPLGATERQVIAAMGKPESSGGFFTPACTGHSACYEWSVHQNFQYVCFGPDKKVVCRGTYTVWE